MAISLDDAGAMKNRGTMIGEAPAESPRIRQARKASVLLIDARSGGLRVMEGTLRRDLEVTAVAQPAEALVLLGRRRFDVLVVSAELLDGAAGFLETVGEASSGVA